MLIAAVVVGFCETLTLRSLYGTILLEAENEKKNCKRIQRDRLYQGERCAFWQSIHSRCGCLSAFV